MGKLLRVLIVEDVKADATLLIHALRSGGYELEYELVAAEPAMRAALQRQNWDLITSDHGIPNFSAPAALSLAIELRPNIPLVIVSGEIDLNLAVLLIKAGAKDYVQKSELARLVPVVDRVLSETKLHNDQQRTEGALRGSETRYRRLFETARDGILILDAETGQIDDVNPFLTECLGYSREQFLGKKLWELGPFKDSADTKAGFMELQKTGYIRYDSLPLEASDGHAIHVEFVSNVYLVNNERVIQCNIRDITERLRAEKKISDLNADLERRVEVRTSQLNAVNQALEAFNYSVSHDLSAPLRRLQGFIKALEQNYADKLDAKDLDLLPLIFDSATQMKILIDALLRLARLSLDQLKPEPTNLSMLVRSIEAELRHSGPQREVEVIVTDDITAKGDPGLLRVLLENLLNNAWKFTSKQSSGRIEFGSMLQTDKTAVYFVRDNGSGFNMKYANRLFGAFQRFHSQDEFPGTGIGLASVQRIVHRHGGKIWAESAVGKGTTFYFTLNGASWADQHESLQGSAPPSLSQEGSAPNGHIRLL